MSYEHPDSLDLRTPRKEVVTKSYCAFYGRPDFPGLLDSAMKIAESRDIFEPFKDIFSAQKEELDNIAMEGLEQIKNYLLYSYTLEYTGSPVLTGNLRASLYLDGNFQKDPFACDIEFDVNEFLRPKVLRVLGNRTYTYTKNGKTRRTHKNKGSVVRYNGYDYRGNLFVEGHKVMEWYKETKRRIFEREVD